MENTANSVSTAPVGQLKTNKGLLKTILLSIITFGIYGIVVMSSVSNDINVVASRYDGKKTMHYCLLVFLVGPLTLGIGYIGTTNCATALAQSFSAGVLRTASAPGTIGFGTCWVR